MKTILSIFSLILVINPLFAQFENIDLSKYKLPDLKRHQLDLMFDHSNGFTNDQEENSKHLSFDESLDANYSYFFISRKRQSNYLIGFNSDFNFDKDKWENSASAKEINTDVSISIILDELFYLQEEKWYIHLGTNSNIAFYKDNHKQKNSSTNNLLKSRNWNINPELELGAGIGRIEPVGDFRQAIYILDELFKNQRLDRFPVESEVIEIASKISELKNKRFFDSRIRKIYEIQSIDSLLNNMGIMEEQDAVYYTILNDMWDYGREERYSGTRVQFDLAGGYYYTSNKSDVSNANYENSEYLNRNHQSYGFKINLDSHKPIKLKWQRYFEFMGYLRYFTEVKFNESSNRSSYPFEILFVYAKYGYNWFLNTRTSANLDVYANYNNYYSSEANFPDRDATSFGLHGGINYYFSPRLRLIFDIQAQQRCLELPFEDEEQKFILNNHLRINYAIF